MRFSVSLLILSASTFLATANPLPKPETPFITEQGEPCRNAGDPSYSQQNDGDQFWTDWMQYSGVTCDAAGTQACSLSSQDQFEQGIEVGFEVGVDIAATEILGLSVGVSVAFSQAHANAVSATINCDPGLVCGLLYRARMQKVKGVKSQPQSHPLGSCPNVDSDYKAAVPVLAHGNNKENLPFNAVSEWRACFISFVDNKYREVEHLDDYVLCPGQDVTVAYPNTDFTWTLHPDPKNVDLHVK